MRDDIHFVTLLFSKVKEPDKFIATLKRKLSFPIVKTVAQNDGIVAVVVRGFEEGSEDKFMEAFCNEFGFHDVKCYSSKGNIFDF